MRSPQWQGDAGLPEPEASVPRAPRTRAGLVMCLGADVHPTRRGPAVHMRGASGRRASLPPASPGAVRIEPPEVLEPCALPKGDSNPRPTGSRSVSDDLVPAHCALPRARGARHGRIAKGAGHGPRDTYGEVVASGGQGSRTSVPARSARVSAHPIVSRNRSSNALLPGWSDHWRAEER